MLKRLQPLNLAPDQLLIFLHLVPLLGLWKQFAVRLANQCVCGIAPHAGV